MTTHAPAAATLTIATEHRGSSTIITATGTIDASNAAELAASVHGLLVVGSRRLILDLAHIDFLDAAALGIIATARAQTAKLDGMLCLVCPRTHQRHLFMLTGLDQAIKIHTDIDAAVSDQCRRRPAATHACAKQPPTG